MARNKPVKILTAVMAWTLTLTTVVVLPGRPRSDLPDWLDSSGAAGPVQQLPWQDSSSAPLAESRPTALPRVVFPAPAIWEAPLGEIAPAAVRERPVQVTAEQAAPGEAARVEVLGRDVAEQVGASGFVFKVSGSKRTGPVELTIDYSGFAHAYGGGYAGRLRVVAVPDCALADPRPSDCAAETPLAASNDRTAQTLTVEVNDLSEAGAFAVVSAVGGDAGTFAATTLSASGSWQVSPGSGAFSYSYPIAVPAPAAGSAPSVSLSYSSAAIDGLTLATNTQASPVGVGWSDFANAFIERRYEPCFRNIGTTDLCWKSDNATISLNGISGALIPTDAGHTRWKVQSDPGWRIERLTDAPYTNIHEKQYWRVTGPDGTLYYFGYGHMPGKKTNSILGVQVVADNPGEPCRALGGCEQGWRWYLDRVVDPDGNVQSFVYEREDNWYHSLLGALGGQPMSRYHRAALLKEIYYGGRGWNADSYSAKVTFGLQWRCAYLVSNCPAATPNHTGFPDVPTDLICASSGSCAAHAPSFFTARRYSHVRTDVKIGNRWAPVAQHNIIHSFGDGENGLAWKLQVEELQHAAIAFGKLNAYPTTKFGYVFNDNRVDHGGHIAKAMRHNRINRITNPFGGVTAVTYFRNRACAGSYDPWPRWDLNDRDCFPQYIKDGAYLREGVFNKYLVRQVVESPGVGSPNMTTTYTYEGTPAWAFDTGAFARDSDEIGWSRWLGYGTVTIAKGASKTRMRLFRGWHQDLAMRQDTGGDWVPTGRRTEHVSALTGGESYVDHPALAGRVLEEQQLGTLDGVADSVIQTRRHEYERRITFDPGPDYMFDAEWVGLRSTTEGVATAPGVWRERRSTTTYNANEQATTTLEEGWLDSTGDERCSITTYADNLDKGMFVYPAMNKTVAGNCSSTNILSLSETYYDGSTTLGAAPSRGNPTRQRTLIEAGRWSETTTEFDGFGRPTRVTNPLGAVTTTRYTVTAGAPASQIPIRITTTNALGHQAVTDYHPEFGVPKREQDANGNVTEQSYDEFGRLIAVWLPTEPLALAEPSWRFSYDIANRAVRSRRLVSQARCCEDARFEDTWVIYDGFWRERQAQGMSPASGRVLVSETVYDNRGLVRDETVEQALTGTPGKYLNGGSSWLNRTRHSYDELGREVRKEWLRGSAVAHATVTTYGVDTVTVTGPDGRKVRERIDAFGNTRSVAESAGQDWAASTYGYDLAGRLVSVTDPAGNRMSYTYNLAGWRTSQQDPNRGSAVFGYDNAGNMTVVVDAIGNQIHSKYDALGRKVERRAGSPTGQLLASWVFDTAPGGKGKLHKEITHTSVGDWVTESVGYDIKGRLTGSRLVVPQGLAGLSGTYETTQEYDRADRVRSLALPAIGGLPRETLTTDYNDLGLPTRLAGLQEYVWGVTHDDRGRATTAKFGPRPGGAAWMAKTWTYDVDQRLNGAETFIAGSGVVSDHDLVFSPNGNLAEKLTRQNGSAWRECFGYDARHRLTSAHTVAPTSACSGGTPGTGDQPYQHSYEYSVDAKLTARTEDGVRTEYTYPATGSARPHAPTRVGGSTFSWDAKGNLVTGDGQSYSWDVQGMLRSVTGTGGTTSFVYDASGQRMLRHTPDGRSTLYLAGHELTVDASGSVVSAVRPYTFDGQLVATRTLSGVEYLVSDATGSVEMAVASGGTPTATRTYAPFGRVRAQDGDLATDRGFAGQIEDASTGLSYMNARYYDAAIGVFISTDAVYNTSEVKSLNPYSYSFNNPATFADPSGLYSMYSFGLEVENSRLKAQNKELRAHIGRLSNHIEQLQDVIRKQQKSINELVTYARALEAEIARQAGIIRKLQQRVRYLEGVVAAQRREISRLRRVVAYQARIIRYQAGVIRYQAGVIGYYKGVVNKLGFRLWGGTGRYASVMASIHSFRGIPGGAFGYDNVSRARVIVVRGSSGGGGSGVRVRYTPSIRWAERHASAPGGAVGALFGSGFRWAEVFQDQERDPYIGWNWDTARLLAESNGIVGTVSYADTARQMYQESDLPDPGGLVTCNAIVPMLFDDDC